MSGVALAIEDFLSEGSGVLIHVTSILFSDSFAQSKTTDNFLFCILRHIFDTEADTSHLIFSKAYNFYNIALRFDPLEGKPCICQIDQQGTSARLKAANAAGRVEKGDLFLTTDPVYQINIKEQQETLKISGTIAVLSMEEALERANGLLARKSSLAFWRK